MYRLGMRRRPPRPRAQCRRQCRATAVAESRATSRRSRRPSRPPTVPSLRLSDIPRDPSEPRDEPLLDRETSQANEDQMGGPFRPFRLTRQNAQVNLRRPLSSDALRRLSSIDASVVDLVPRRLISNDRSLDTLRREAADTCAICLEDFEAGDTVACMPCAGLHKSHWACIRRWLQERQTCPSCRWGLPSGTTCPDQTHALMARADDELRRLRVGRVELSLAEE